MRKKKLPKFKDCLKFKKYENNILKNIFIFSKNFLFFIAVWNFWSVVNFLVLVWKLFVKLINKKFKGVIILIILAISAVVFVKLVLIIKSREELVQDLQMSMQQQTESISLLNRDIVTIKEDNVRCDNELYILTVRNEELESQLRVQEEQDKVIATNSETAKNFVGNYRGGISPMKEYVDQFYKGDLKKGTIALAIAGNESAFGLVGAGSSYYNAWGYGCNYGGIRFNCGWGDKPISQYGDFIAKNGLESAPEQEIRWRYAISRYMEEADKYLALYDGSCGSIGSIASNGYYRAGMDGAGQEQVDKWVSNVCWFANNLFIND